MVIDAPRILERVLPLRSSNNKPESMSAPRRYPEFDPETRNELRDTLDYPAEDSLDSRPRANANQ